MGTLMDESRMITDAVLPNWPPPPDEPIGEERARQYIAWIRDQAPPLVAEGRRMLQERYPGKATQTAAVNVAQLAIWTLSDRMTGLNIGGVYTDIMPGTWGWMDVRIRRDGRLELRPGLRMRH
jgi:hypothetical protein